MKKSTLPILAILGLGLAVMLVANPVSAGSSGAIRANIPFDFAVGKTTLPAGEYTVDMDRLSSGVVKIRGAETGRSVFIIANTAVANGSMNESSLVFNRYGDQYFLSRVWTAGSDIGCELPKSPAEREISRAYRLAKGHPEVQTVAIAADRQ